MAEREAHRRLSAILAADVVGYSRLMENDTEGTVAAWRDARDEIIKPEIATYSGNIIKFTGDGFLAEFPTVLDAIKCAIALQTGFSSSRLEFRIGINLGDIVDDGEDIHGEGVNVAARLEGLSDPGGICISGSVYEQVRNRLDVKFDDMGQQLVKNISAPVQVYRVLAKPEKSQSNTEKKSTIGKKTIASALAVILIGVAVVFVWQPWVAKIEKASIDKMALPLPKKPSIAVLPFTNLSGDSKQDAFSDGMTEDIITALSKVPDMFVIARNSTFTYKGKAVKVQKVAEDLGVRFVLEGSIQRSENKVRITAQLIDALSGNHLWAERYDRELKDIFALQDDITRNVVTALQVKLTAGEAVRVWRRQTENTEAYEAFLQGNAVRFYGAHSKTINAEAREYYEKAVALDPEFASAWLGVSAVHQIDSRYGFVDDRARSLGLAEDAARRALVIDDTFADAYMVLANIKLINRQYDQVIVNCEKALSLNPSPYAMAHCGRMWTQVGRADEALYLIQKAMRRNPYFEGVYFFTLGNAHRMLGNYDAAITAFEARRDVDPDVLGPLVALAAAYAEAGRMEEARATIRDALRRFPKFSLKLPEMVLRYQDPAEIERILAYLREAGLPE